MYFFRALRHLRLLKFLDLRSAIEKQQILTVVERFKLSFSERKEKGLR